MHMKIFQSERSMTRFFKGSCPI